MRAANALFRFDEALRIKRRARFIIGIDEAGRGPLAGPVVAAAVVLEIPYPIELDPVRDSKKLTPIARERLFGIIRRLSVQSALACSLPEEIDRLNIFQASLVAMGRAFNRLRLDLSEALVVVDGPWRIPGLPCAQEPVVDGDAKSLSVACASIMAKVVRDRWMRRLDLAYPGYSFSAHKGYGTAAHLESINRLGPSPIHRKSFEPVARLLRA